MKDAAVNRLAKSITQLTPCQVTTDEVDAATKLLDKACQKLQGIQNIPSYANFAKLTAYWIAAQFLLAKRRKLTTASAYSQRSKYIIGRAQCTNLATHWRWASSSIWWRLFAGALGHWFFCTPQWWAMRHVLVGYLSPLPHSGRNSQLSAALGLSSKHHQSWAQGIAQEYDDRKSTTERTPHLPSCFTARFTFAFLTLEHVSLSVSPFFSPLSLRRGVVVVCF